MTSVPDTYKTQVVDASGNIVNSFGSTNGLVTKPKEFIRPNDTTQYTAGDIISESTTFAAAFYIPDLARINGGTFYITGATLRTNQATCVAQLRLWLYNAMPTTQVDNAAMLALYANSTLNPVYHDLPALSSEAAGSDCAYTQDNAMRLRYTCAQGVRGIWVVIQTKTTFTPDQLQKFYLTLTADQNPQ